MDNLDQIRRMALFSIVCRHGGFAAAARELGLTRSAVSRQVSVLESELGVRLLQRTTRRSSPTEAGRLLLPRCDRILREAQEGAAAVAALAEAPVGRLVIGAPMGLAEAFLAPVLPTFGRENPGLQLDLRVSDQLTDLLDGEVDVVVRAGSVDSSDLVGRRLGPLAMVVCAAPAYLGSRGMPTLATLPQESWLLFAPMPPLLQIGSATVRPEGQLRTDSGAVLKGMVVAGAGLALMPRFFVERELASGALVELFAEERLPVGSVWALHGHGRRPPRKIRAFVDFAVRQWRQSRPVGAPPMGSGTAD